MREKTKSKPNIILIVLDTLRADHLSSYGYRRRTSPNIDKIAKQGVLFENAFSAANWTPPSHASIFTGKYPSRHKTIGKNIFLEKENTTLAEILSWNGYQTIGITNNRILGIENGFQRGFQEYVEIELPALTLKHIKLSPKDFLRTLIYGPDHNTYITNELIIRYLKRNYIGKKPFFLFVNYMNCHERYDPPRPFKERFCDYFSESRFHAIEVLYQNLGVRISNKFIEKTTEKIHDSNLSIRKLNFLVGDGGHQSINSKKLQVSQKEWEVIKAWYDGEIAYLDYRIGELIDILYDEGIFDRTLLIITSDHGENLGEHGLAGHHFCLYDNLLHVPLIMICPNIIPRKRRITNLVSTIDIFPTVLDILNIKKNRNEIQGRSLVPFEDRKIHDFIVAEEGESITEIRPVFAPFRSGLKELDKGSKCLRTESYKYMLSSDQKEELYDLRNDPFERVDVSCEYPKKLKYFKKQLKKTVDIAYFGPKEIPVAKERKEIILRLKALGYW